MRALLASSLVAAFVLAGAAPSSAEEWKRPPLKMVPHAPPDTAAHGGDEAVSDIIYINRCVGGCQITKSSTNNALTDESTIPNGNDGQTFTISEFAHGDEVWNTLMDCLRDVYSPYNVTITDQDPGNVPHHEAIASGLPAEVGLSNIGGIAPSGCDPRNNVISYSFLNDYPASQVLEMCATVAQESAHSFGLGDHIYDCTDPMTYLVGCGRKYFRNKLMPCGEFEQRECNCTGNRQNPHVKLLSVFGEGTQPPPPTASITYPSAGQSISTMLVQVQATDPRGIYKIELFLNGWLWHVYEQPEMISPPYSPPLTYALQPGTQPPNGVYDIEVRVSNDLGSMTTATVQATKGSPCSDASGCLAGQRCEAGKCLWDPPSSELGEDCTYAQQCIGPNTYDGRCESGDGMSICTRDCYTGVNDDCPEGFACLETNAVNGTGVCWPTTDSGGCCSTSGRPATRGALIAQLALLGIVAMVVLRRRRR